MCTTSINIYFCDFYLILFIIITLFLQGILNIISSNGVTLAKNQNGCKLLQNYANHAKQYDRTNFFLSGRLSFVCETLLMGALARVSELAENIYG